MVEIQVEKMSCGGCASRVTKAVLALDEEAKVNVDLKSKRVCVASTSQPEEVAKAISSAGYPAKVVSKAV